MSIETAVSVEETLSTLLPVLAAIAVILLIRYIIGRLLSSLVERGTLTLGTKIAILRFVNIAVLIAILIIILQVVTASHLVIFAIAVLVVVGGVIFFYELKEFAAYINIQLLRHLRGRVFEITLPYHEKPIYGRIVNIEPTGSTIEDMYGRKVYVSNTLLMNSILRDYQPCIPLRITVKKASNSVTEVIDKIVESLNKAGHGLFRVDESDIVIENMSESTLTLKVLAHPAAIPVRAGDLARIAETLIDALKPYSPSIEVVS